MDPHLTGGWLGPAGQSSTRLPRAVLRALGSLRLALVALGLLGGGVVWTALQPGVGTLPIVLPLGLLSVNLGAAVAVHPAFRRNAPLLVFHLALLAIVLLAGLGRLTYLKGHLELSAGEAFHGRLSAYEAGPWHPWGIRDLRFTNGGFTIDYLPGRQRDHTRAHVSYRDATGRPREVVVGDQVPLTLDGYRFYTSHNKGFALVFSWTPAGGATRLGTVHLPAYPLHEYRQANTWAPPGADAELWVQLQFDEPLLSPEGPARFRTPASHRVVVRSGGERTVLTPGGAMAVGDGRLVYRGVRTWMGYKVFYDRTIPWLLAACVVAVLSLGWHFWRKYRGRPWWRERDGEEEAP